MGARDAVACGGAADSTPSVKETLAARRRGAARGNPARLPGPGACGTLDPSRIPRKPARGPGRRGRRGDFPGGTDGRHGPRTSSSARCPTPTSRPSPASTRRSAGRYRPDFWEQRVGYYLRRDPEASQVAEVGRQGGRASCSATCAPASSASRSRAAGSSASASIPTTAGGTSGKQLFDALRRALRAARARRRCARWWISNDAGVAGFLDGARLRAVAAAGARDAADPKPREQPMKVENDHPREEVPRRGRALAPALTSRTTRRCSTNWEKYFPKDEPFCLCAKMEIGTSGRDPDRRAAGREEAPQARRAHRGRRRSTCSRSSAPRRRPSSARSSSTPARCDRAHDDEDRFWVLRVMAEELRHGYQMLHLLLAEDWTHVSGGVKGEQMVEEILSMQTGIHVLDAFNLDYDSFIDNIVFAALIDRVGKYQLTMQKVCAYKPMADSMPPMLREEAFHLAAGVIPLRRWAQRAAQGDPLVTMHGDPEVDQQVVPARARDVRRRARRRQEREVRLQGHEEPRGAGLSTSRRCAKMVRDINMRFLRARFPRDSPEKVERVLESSSASAAVAGHGVRTRTCCACRTALLPPQGRAGVPDGRRRRRDVHRRRGVPALPRRRTCPTPTWRAAT